MITEEQRQLRRSGVGGSDIAPIMGLSPYANALDIYNAKTGEDIDLSDNPSVEWGSRLEDVIGQKFAENHPEYQVTLSPDTVIKNGWKIANVDGLLTRGGETGVLEIKTANAFTKDWVDGVPIYYQCQVQWYMHILDVPFAWVCVLIGGQTYREYLIDRDTVFIGEIVHQAEQFWNDFCIGVAPHMPELVKPVEGQKIEFPEAVEMLQRLREIEGEKKLLEGEKKLLKSKFIDIMGSNEELTVDGKTAVTWKIQETSRFDQSRFREAHPDLYAEFCNTSETRVMKFKK